MLLLLFVDRAVTDDERPVVADDRAVVVGAARAGGSRCTWTWMVTLALRVGEKDETPLRSVNYILVSKIRIFTCFTSFSH